MEPDRAVRTDRLEAHRRSRRVLDVLPCEVPFCDPKTEGRSHERREALEVLQRRTT